MKKAVKKTKGTATYKNMHDRIGGMTEEELIDAIFNVVNSKTPRVDMLQRLVGRFNRQRGLRFMTGVMGLLSTPPGKRDVDALLDSNS